MFKLFLAFLLLVFTSQVTFSRSVDREVYTAHKREVWLAFVVGSSSIRKGWGTIEVFSASSYSKLHAEWKALNICTDKAFHCQEAPSVSTTQLCRYAVASMYYGRYILFFGIEPDMLEAECVHRLGQLTCSQAAGICK